MAAIETSGLRLFKGFQHLLRTRIKVEKQVAVSSEDGVLVKQAIIDAQNFGQNSSTVLIFWPSALGQSTKYETENRKQKTENTTNSCRPTDSLSPLCNVKSREQSRPSLHLAKCCLLGQKSCAGPYNFITRLPGFSLLSNATALALAPSPFAWISVPIKFTKLNDKFLPQIVANRIKVNSRINRAFPPSVENQCSLRSIFPPHFPASRPAKGACLSVSQECVAGRGGLGRVEGKVVLAWPSRCGHFNAHNPYR